MCIRPRWRGPSLLRTFSWQIFPDPVGDDIHGMNFENSFCIPLMQKLTRARLSSHIGLPSKITGARRKGFRMVASLSFRFAASRPTRWSGSAWTFFCRYIFLHRNMHWLHKFPGLRPWPVFLHNRLFHEESSTALILSRAAHDHAYQALDVGGFRGISTIRTPRCFFFLQIKGINDGPFVHLDMDVGSSTIFVRASPALGIDKNRLDPRVCAQLKLHQRICPPGVAGTPRLFGQLGRSGKVIEDDGAAGKGWGRVSPSCGWFRQREKERRPRRCWYGSNRQRILPREPKSYRLILTR